MLNMVVLISGNGTNLQAILDACQCGFLSINITGVISNNPAALGLARARRAGVPIYPIDAATFTSKQHYELHLAHLLEQLQPDLVVLAGYMRILGPKLVQRYLGRLLNIHPSLLPRYPGLATHRKALQNGDAWHGASVHFVTEQLDGGPVILQSRVPVLANDDEHSLAERVHQQEHRIYPQVIGWFAEGRLYFKDDMAFFDHHPLPASGISVSQGMCPISSELA